MTQLLTLFEGNMHHVEMANKFSFITLEEQPKNLQLDQPFASFVLGPPNNFSVAVPLK